MKSIFLICVLAFLTSPAYAISTIVKATGQSQVIDVTGADGRNGSDGSSASSANCLDNESRNGDNGADGEKGEDGNNGGDVLIQYQNLANVKSIYVNASGGEGGRGGSGGSGGFGCGGGWSGSTGQSGSSGSDGSAGSLYLLNSFENFIPTKVDDRAEAGKVLVTPLVLTKNIWEKQTGAEKLLAPSSNVSDTYYLYKSRVQKTFRLAWNSPKVPTGLSLYAKMNDTFGLQYSFYGASLVMARATPTNDGILIAVSNFYSKNELFALQVSVLAQAKKDQIQVVDNLVIDSAIQTQYWANVYQKHSPLFGDSWTELKYRMAIPAAYVVKNGNKTTIDIETMKKRELKSFTGTSKKIFLNLEVRRVFESQSDGQEFPLKYKL